MSELKKKKLINEFERVLINDDVEKLQKNSNIPSEVLAEQSINGIVTDPENRTLWINGMPFGNAYATLSSTATEVGPFHSEVFNDFETNVALGDYSHVEGHSNNALEGAKYSHVEGSSNIVSSESSHAEGSSNVINANCPYSHIEGKSNNISAEGSHIEGLNNSSSGKYSHVEGKGNKTTNDYEHAEGFYNWSQEYNAENGNDLINDGNKIVSTIGIGNEIIGGKNAVRLNKDGALYLAGVTKKTDTIVEVFNPCEYDGQSIYTATLNSDKRTLKSKSVQEVLSGINHMESITYWRLKQLADLGKLLPGKSYRIIDYNIGLSPELNSFKIKDDVVIEYPKLILSSQTVGEDTLTTIENNFNRFDIIVTAISKTEFSNIAKACKHDFYGYETKANYFETNNLNDWTLYYDFTNNNAKYNWINTASKEPSIRITSPTLDTILKYSSDDYFGTKNILKGSGYINDAGEVFSKFYEVVTSGVPEENKRNYFVLVPGNGVKYVSGDSSFPPNGYVTFDALKYNYAGTFYYIPDAELNFDKDPENSEIKPFPINKLSNYNYKWLAEIGNEYISKNYEYCLLTNEVDFSYINTNSTKKQESNIIFCKNNKQVVVTEYNKEIEINSDIIGPYYESLNSYPYVLQIERTIKDNKEDIEGKKYYTAFLYGGQYKGNYNEVVDAEQDVWYILQDYKPQDNQYVINKDTRGSIHFITNRKKADGSLYDYTNIIDFKEALRTDTDYNLFSFYHDPALLFTGNVYNELLTTENCNAYSIDEPGKNENGEDILIKKYIITISGEKIANVLGEKINNLSKSENFIKSEYLYEYNGNNYEVWEQQTIETFYNYFLITPKKENVGEFSFTNIDELILVCCPRKDMEYFSSISNVDILEYNIYNVKDLGANSDGNYTFDFYNSNTGNVDDSINFPVGMFRRNIEKPVFQEEEYFSSYNVLKNDNYYGDFNIADFEQEKLKQYRIIVKNSLKIPYLVNNLTPFKSEENSLFETNVLFEECLLPICYVELKTGGDFYTEGKYESTGVIYRMIDEYGNDCPYDFKNIKMFNCSDTETANAYEDKNLCYTYTFGGVITDETIEQPYKDLRYVGDKSLNGSCINNKIINSNLSGINFVYFRLSKDSSLMNNTFIDCYSCGSKCEELDILIGSQTNMINNVFKECENLDLMGFRTVSNNQFYKFSDTSLNAKGEVGTQFINSTIINSSISYAGEKEITEISYCKITDSDVTTTRSIIINSDIYNNDLNGGIDRILAYDDLYIDREFHKIKGDTLGFNLNSTKDINLTTSNGYVTLYVTKSIEEAAKQTLYSKKYIQYLSYNSGSTKGNYVNGTRDNGSASNTVNFEYIFDKKFEGTNNDTGIAPEYPVSGSGYTLPRTYFNDNNLKARYNLISTTDSSYGPNKLFLGTFYANCNFTIWTFWGQHKAVYGEGSLNATVEIYKPGNSTPAFTIKAGYGNPGYYWSERKWTTYTVCPYINFDKLIANRDLGNLNGYTDGQKDGSIIISDQNGNLLVEKIKFTFNWNAYSDSTGANNCVEDVWVSPLYHNKSTSWNAEGYFGGAQAANYNTSTIYYYKPNTYPEKNDSGQHNKWIFGTNGIGWGGQILNFSSGSVEISQMAT
jgi:hypothetical protein